MINKSNSTFRKLENKENYQIRAMGKLGNRKTWKHKN